MSKLDIKVPEGTRDILYAESELYRNLNDGFNAVYEQFGFSRVETPMIENFDLISTLNSSIRQENMYKLTDNTGKLLVLRPDNTTPIARVAATKLRNAELPQKLYYNQSIFRINNDYSGKRNEIYQSGIELIGTTGMKSDLLCIITALEAMKTLGLKCKLEIGHAGFFNSLLDAYNLSAEQDELLRDLVEMKRSMGIEEMLPDDKLRKLPMLYGEGEVFEAARELAGDNEPTLSALEDVEKLYNLLVKAGYGEYIIVDLGMVPRFDYYTGILLRGYIDNAGEPVLKGGRYDKLLANFGCDIPATGFAINICAVADAMIKFGMLPELKATDVIIHYNEEFLGAAIEKKQSYESKGLKCELSTFDKLEDTISFAEKMNIPTVDDQTTEKECVK